MPCHLHIEHDRNCRGCLDVRRQEDEAAARYRRERWGDTPGTDDLTKDYFCRKCGRFYERCACPDDRYKYG